MSSRQGPPQNRGRKELRRGPAKIVAETAVGRLELEAWGKKKVLQHGRLRWDAARAVVVVPALPALQQCGCD